MTREDIKSKCVTKLRDIQKKAEKAELYYVACFWEWCPNYQTVESRVGYFEDIIEAKLFCTVLSENLRNSGVPFYITSNILDAEDGGLFNDQH